MRVVLRNPTRELDIEGPLQVAALLDRLDLNREAHLVIANTGVPPGQLDRYQVIRPVVTGIFILAPHDVEVEHEPIQAVLHDVEL